MNIENTYLYLIGYNNKGASTTHLRRKQTWRIPQLLQGHIFIIDGLFREKSSEYFVVRVA